MLNRFITLAICLILATSGTASAATRFAPQNSFAQPDAKAGQVGGIVNSSGGIVYGSGFQISHPETGEYIVTIGANVFKKCPIVNITPAGTNSSPPLANLYSYGCGAGGVSLTILMIGSTTGQPEDNAFHFTAIQP